MVIGLMLIVIGLVFFAKALGFVTADTLSVLWPLLLIVLGLNMLSHHIFGHHKSPWNEIVGSPKKKK